MRTTVRRRAGALLVAAAALAPAACSADGEPEKAGRSPAPPPRLPLTGQVAKGGLPDRPVVVVKVDNTADAEPQVGLRAADLVVEEVVEGGVTRLAVAFHSRLPDEVGPVRSMRTTDIGLVAPTGGLLVASGSAGRVQRAVDAAGVPTAAEGADGFSRDPGRQAPYDLLVDPAALLSGLADRPEPPPQAYLPWSTSTASSPAGRPVRSAEVTFSPAQTTEWSHTAAGWTRDNGLAAAGKDFAADHLLVLRTRTRDAGYRDPAGNPVPETVTTGSGRAVLLLGGRRVDARWHKDGTGEPFRLTAGGRTLRLPPGRAWLELVPEDGSVRTG